MTRGRTVLRLLGAHAFALVLVLIAALGLGGRLADRWFDREMIAVPVPLPVYEIEAVSGGHRATLLGLPIAPLGAVGVPIPVDVNGDLLPDVTVAVNLVNVAGLLDGPGNEPLLAPAVEINRLLPGLPLFPVNPDLKINVKLTVLDVGSTEPPLILRLGYETGPGGSIPGQFKVVAGGLTSFFNPVEALVEAPGYEGPLSLVAGFEQGTSRTDADLRFDPLPTGLAFSYGSDDAGEHLGVDHLGAPGATAVDREVDLAAAVTSANGADRTRVDARIDRLPRSMDAVIAPGADGVGGFDYEADADGRLPDVRLDLSDVPASGPPLVARLDIEGLPPELHAAWSLADDEPTAVRIDAPQRPIGAVEARVANFLGAPTELPAYLPTTQQFVDVRQPRRGGERLVTGRVEGVQLVELTETDGGVDAAFRSSGGGQPLELNATLGDIGDRARRIDARTTISPLPTEVTASIRDAGDDQTTDPMVVVYESSESIDVDAHVEVRREGQTLADPCGAVETVCADLSLRDVPIRIETRIADLEVDEDDDDAVDIAESRIEVDSDLRPFASAPDVTASLTMADEEGQVVEASVAARAIPRHVRLRLVEREGALERAEFHACAQDYGTGECADGSAGSIAALDFGVRNFLEGARPSGLPRPILDRSQHIAVVGDGDAAEDGARFEAAGRLTSVEEVQYVAGTATGLRVAAGAGEEFLGEVELRDIDPDPTLPDPDGGSEAERGGEVFDLDAEVHVPALPGSLDVCFRSQGHEPTSAAPDPVTEQCEPTSPFGDDVELAGTPLSFGYAADTEFDIDGSVHTRDQGREAFLEPDPRSDDTVVDAALDVAGLPNELVTHLLLPAGEGERDGPSEVVRAHFGASGTTDRIEFSGGRRLGDAECRDPRPGAEAMCVSGVLTDFPDTVDLYFDPSLVPTGLADLEADDNNLVVHTSGTGASLTDFHLSSVTRVEPEEDEEGPPTSDVFIVDGSLLNLPEDLVGKLYSPQPDIEDDEAAMSFEANPSLGRLDLTVQDFAPPDLFAAVPPPHAGAATDHPIEIAVQQYGERTKARVKVPDLQRAGFAPVRDAEGRPLDTKAITLGFVGPSKSVRAYLDLAKSSTEHVTADVIVQDLPNEIDVCVRGERTAGAAAPAEGLATWCDGVDDDQGAVRVKTGEDATGIDLDAYVRQVAVGAPKLAARLAVIDLPATLQVGLPIGEDADLELEGLAGDGTPRGIGQIDAELASAADIEVDGWTDLTRPFTRRPLPTRPTHPGSPFPAEATGRQHLAVAKAGDLLHVQAFIGDRTPGIAGSELRRLDVLNEACPAPQPTPPDHPEFPDGAENKYQCVRAGFSPPSSGLADPLDLSIAEGFQDQQGEIRRLHHAGLTDIPERFQMTLSDAPTTEGEDEELRDRCPTVSDDVIQQGKAAPIEIDPLDCVPPLLRFDKSEGASELFGAFDDGDAGVLADPDLIPEDPTIDFDAVPTGRGLRVKVLKPPATEGSAITARFRLALPRSLTIEQPQQWSEEVITNAGTTQQGAAESSKDVRVAYAVRTAAGQPVDDALGSFAVYVRDGDKDLLVRDADDPGAGITLPGELSLDLYVRDTALQGRTFLQADGRTTVTLDLGVHLFDRSVRPDVVSPEPDVNDNPEVDAAGLERVSFQLLNLQPIQPGMAPDEPSFRVRFEKLGAPKLYTQNTSTATMRQQFIGSLDATLDLAPGGVPSRRVEAVLYMDAPRIGFEIEGYPTMTGPQPATGQAQLSIHASLFFDKMNYRLTDDANDNHIKVVSRLRADLDVTKATNFRLRNNIAGIDAHLVGGDDSTAMIGPFIWEIDQFRYEKDVTLGLQAEIEYEPLFPDPVFASFYECPSGPEGPPMTEGLELTAADPDYRGMVKLTTDFRFGVNVLWVPELVVDILVGIGDFFGLADDKDTQVTAALCALDPGDYQLIRHDDGGPKTHPGDPIGVQGHDVPPTDPDDPPVSEDVVLTPPVTPAPPSPDRDITGIERLCGVHQFDELIVSGILFVADAADPTPTPSNINGKCPAGQEGGLILNTRTAEVRSDAFVVASFLNTTPDGTPNAPVGNGGGGNFLRGGSGSTGVGGFTSLPFDVVDGGQRGGGAAGGAGGGHVYISGRVVTVAGSILALGGNAGDGSCDAATGLVPGSGGGAGGGVWLMGTHVNATGIIDVRGGAGGTGYGGGGGGATGRFKVTAPAPDLSGDYRRIGGLPGGNCSSDNLPEAKDGITGQVEADLRPTPEGQINSVARVWVPSGSDPIVDPFPDHWAFSGIDLRFGYEAHGPVGHWAFLCITRQDDLNESFTMPAPAPVATESPCGVDSARGGVRLVANHQGGGGAEGIINASGCLDDDEEVCPSGTDLQDGVYGAWLHICRLINDAQFLCNKIPTAPDYVFGVDFELPEVSVTSPGSTVTTFTNPNAVASATGAVPLAIEVVRDTFPRGAPIDQVLCHHGPVDEDPPPELLSHDPADGHYAPCPEGLSTRTFPDGLSVLTVRAVDRAHNGGHASLVVMVDRTMPTTQITVTPQEPGNDGWMRANPIIDLDVADQESGLADLPVVYELDGVPRTIARSACAPAAGSGDRLRCQVPDAVLNTLGSGEHTIRAAAVDVAGNQLLPGETPEEDERPSATFLIDRLPPAAAAVVLPPVPDSGWYTAEPLVALGAVDDLGGSGLVREPADSVGVFYDIDGGPEHWYDGPFRVGSTAQTVCWRSVDVAGHETPRQCAPVIQLDLARPTVTLAPTTGPGPAGWYLSAATITAAVTDGQGGSGVAADALRVSVDGGPFQPYTGVITAPEGIHTVRAFAVDRAGHRSDLQTVVVRIDESAPVVAARLTPPTAARAGWWRRLPTLVLRATDGGANAGVAVIEYRVGNGAFRPYTGPVDLPAGRSSITYRAVDRVGRASAEGTLTVPVDTGAPSATALSPTPALWIRLFGPPNATLTWKIGDDRSGAVRVTVQVVDLLGNVIRWLDAGSVTVAPGTTKTGSVAWDGKNQAGKNVIGVFHYRVVVVDEAGHRAQSGESRPIQIKL